MLRIEPNKRAVVSLVTASVFADMLLYNIVVPFLPQCAAGETASETAVGLLFGGYAAAQLAATPFMGRPTGRWGCRLVLLWGMGALAFGTALCAVLPSFAGMLMGRIVQGAGSAAIWTAGFALIAEVLTAEERGRGLGIVMSGTSAGALVGPVVGGYLFEWGGYLLPFAIGGGICVGVGAALWAFLPSLPGKAETAGYRILLGRRDCRASLWAVLAGAVTLSLLEPLLPLHLSERFNWGPGDIGMLFGLAALAYGVSAPVAGRLSDRFGGARVMAWGLVATAASVPLCAFSTHWLAEAGALALLGGACSFLLTPALPALADLADRHGSADYGMAYALFNVAYSVGMVAGPILGGVMASLWGFATAVIVLSCSLLALRLLLPKHVPASAIAVIEEPLKSAA